MSFKHILLQDILNFTGFLRWVESESIVTPYNMNYRCRAIAKVRSRPEFKSMSWASNSLTVRKPGTKQVCQIINTSLSVHIMNILDRHVDDLFDDSF